MPILTQAAKDGKTISYGLLGKVVGHPAHLLDQALAHIRDEICAKNGWPPLSILVLDGCTGLPLSEPRGDLTDAEYGILIEGLQKAAFVFEGWPG